MVACVLVFGLAAAWFPGAAPARAHHNAHWSRDEHVSLAGTVISTYIGYPHSIMKLDCEGKTWAIYLGQPWHIEDVGLPVEELVPGTLVEVVGSPTEAGGDRQLMVTKLALKGHTYIF